MYIFSIFDVKKKMWEIWELTTNKYMYVDDRLYNVICDTLVYIKCS